MFKSNIYERPLDNQLFTKKKQHVVIKIRKVHNHSMVIGGSKPHRINTKYPRKTRYLDHRKTRYPDVHQDHSKKRKNIKTKKVKKNQEIYIPNMINLPSPSSFKMFRKTDRHFKSKF